MQLAKIFILIFMLQCTLARVFTNQQEDKIRDYFKRNKKIGLSKYLQELFSESKKLVNDENSKHLKYKQKGKKTILNDELDQFIEDLEPKTNVLAMVDLSGRNAGIYYDGLIDLFEALLKCSKSGSFHNICMNYAHKIELELTACGVSYKVENTYEHKNKKKMHKVDNKQFKKQQQNYHHVKPYQPNVNKAVLNAVSESFQKKFNLNKDQFQEVHHDDEDNSGFKSLHTSQLHQHHSEIDNDDVEDDQEEPVKNSQLNIEEIDNEELEQDKGDDLTEKKTLSTGKSNDDYHSWGTPDYREYVEPIQPERQPYMIPGDPTIYYEPQTDIKMPTKIDAYFDEGSPKKSKTEVHSNDQSEELWRKPLNQDLMVMEESPKKMDKRSHLHSVQDDQSEIGNDTNKQDDLNEFSRTQLKPKIDNPLEYSQQSTQTQTLRRIRRIIIIENVDCKECTEDPALRKFLGMNK